MGGYKLLIRVRMTSYRQERPIVLVMNAPSRGRASLPCALSVIPLSAYRGKRSFLL